jgi:intracellular sulfur oxidation DsrE/DsrF family protein
MRRAFLNRAALAVSALVPLAAWGAAAGSSPSAGSAGRIRVAYHLADGTEQATRALASIRNHLRGDPDVQIAVVAIGDGIRLLLKDEVDASGRRFDQQVSALASKGVEFRICENTLTAHGVPLSRVVSEAKVVPAGVVELARLQAREGYVYIRP